MLGNIIASIMFSACTKAFLTPIEPIHSNAVQQTATKSDDED